MRSYELDYEEAFGRLLEYYYSESPGRIMPLFLLFLARESKPNDTKIFIEEKIRKPLDWKDAPEKRYKSPILSQFTQDDAKELAISDQAGKYLLDRWKGNDMDHMSIVVLYDNDMCQKIRSVFQKKDEGLGESMKTRKALFDFVQGIMRIPQEILVDKYLEFANMILKKSQVLDEMEDYDLAMFERWLIGDVKCKVYNPQAKSPFLVSSYTKADIFTESAGPKAEFDSCVSYLLVKGNGCNLVKSIASQKQFSAMSKDDKFDLVIMNRPAYNQYTDITDWHDCLEYVNDNMSDQCRFFGLVENKHLFSMLNTQSIFFENVIKSKDLEMVILLPKSYGCSLVVLNKAKNDPEVIKFVDLYKEFIPAHSTYNYDLICQRIFDENVKEVSFEQLANAQNKLSRFFDNTLPEESGFKLVPLRRFLSRITPASSFSVDNEHNGQMISIINIDPSVAYSPYDYNVEAEVVDTFSLYHNYYCLESCSLIINKQGALNARIYNGWEPAFIKDVLAFAINSDAIYPPYIINELRKPYVKTQLEHWTHSAKGYHSEDEILDLKIYIPSYASFEDQISEEQDICKNELNQNILPNNFEIYPDGVYDKYTIKKFLGKGSFGMSYLANKLGEDKDVVLKEYFFDAAQSQQSKRETDHRVSITLGNVDQLLGEWNAHTYLCKFIQEGELMKEFSRYPGCRIRPAYNLFKCSETNTYYFDTDYYSKGTLYDKLTLNGIMPEKEAIEKIMKPLARALKTMHDSRWLHLDIKPENVFIDDDDMAILGDLGIAQHWDETGKKITNGECGVGSDGASIKQKYCDKDFAAEFHPEQDIYSLAALFYLMLTGDSDHVNFNPAVLDEYDISEESKQAIKAGLLNGDTLETTPKSVIEFIRMLPGCHDIELPEIIPIENEVDNDPDDLMRETDSSFNEYDLSYLSEKLEI